MIRTKAGAATLSIASNSLLIAAKLAAGAITGSIAIVTEAAHSSIDLIASVIAFVSVRMSDEPPDPEHPYGHERFESLAAAIEGMLILVGAGIIVFAATRRLVLGAEVDHVGVGIAVIAGSAVINLAVGGFLRHRGRELRSAALEGDAAHLTADALTSIGVLAGLALVAITGDAVFDPIAALAVAAAIVFSGLRPPPSSIASRRRSPRGAPQRRRWWATTSSARAAPGRERSSTSTSSSAPARASSGRTRSRTRFATRSRPSSGRRRS